MISIEPITDRHRNWIEARTEELFNGSFVISRGQRHEPAKLAGFVAVDDAEIVGIATYRLEHSTCELITIEALWQWQGIGSTLLRSVEEQARCQGCCTLWLVTTNDNVDALRFYQKRGFTIKAVHVNALEQSRQIKPGIPLLGNYGICIRDEIELEKPLTR